MKSRSPQLNLLKNETKAYGGELRKTRIGRAQGRPLNTRNSMHLVLRSSKAKGSWSFKSPANEKKIQKIVGKFSQKYGIKVLSMANVGNHLHFHIKLGSRFTYKPFIRAITASIAMAVTGVSRWKTYADCLENDAGDLNSKAAKNRASRSASSTRFWDYRPFTRVIQGFRDYLRLRDYIEINELEGFGFRRNQARFFVVWNNAKLADQRGMADP